MSDVSKTVSRNEYKRLARHVVQESPLIFVPVAAKDGCTWLVAQALAILAKRLGLYSEKTHIDDIARALRSGKGE